MIREFKKKMAIVFSKSNRCFSKREKRKDDSASFSVPTLWRKRAILQDPSHLTRSLRLNSIHLRTIPSAISNGGIAKGVTLKTRRGFESRGTQRRDQRRRFVFSGRESFVGKYHKSTLTALSLSLIINYHLFISRHEESLIRDNLVYLVLNLDL